MRNALLNNKNTLNLRECPTFSHCTVHCDAGHAWDGRSGGGSVGGEGGVCHDPGYMSQT